MRRIVFGVLLALSVISCGILVEKDDPEMAAKVEKAVRKHDITIDITQILPMMGPIIQSTNEYTFKISGDKANTHLPFFGESHASIIAGVDETGINFKDCPVKIQDNFSKASQGEYIYTFIAKSGRDNVHVQITIWDNGKATIVCSPESKTQMTYNGEVTFEEPRK